MSQLRKLRYRLFSWRRFPPLAPAGEPIDVVIPIIAKDLRVLPLCLEGVRRCVPHPVSAVYIVAPDEPEIRQFCRDRDLLFVDERSVFGFAPSSLGLLVTDGDGSRDRSGWLFQQLVKLSGRVGTCRHYLCIDADHVLIHPHVFLTADGRTVFYMSYEEHRPYYENIARLLPGLPLAPLSYVDHKMLFDKEQLRQLHTALGDREGHPWYQTVIDSYDRRCHAGFSEFELYGNFVKEKELRPWLQKRLPYSRIADYDTLCRRYAGSRWSLTFPDYMRQNQGR